MSRIIEMINNIDKLNFGHIYSYIVELILKLETVVLLKN